VSERELECECLCGKRERERERERLNLDYSLQAKNLILSDSKGIISEAFL